MLSASRVCLASAAGRSALVSGRSKAAAGAAATARSRASPTVLLTHRSLRTSSSSYHLSRSRGGRLAQAVARRRQQASTLSGDKVASPAATAGGKAAASSENKAVATWLFGTAGAVAVMVTVGGITRMTKSGLSMTDWKIQGSLPPSSEVYIYRVNRSCCVEREQLLSSGMRLVMCPNLHTHVVQCIRISSSASSFVVIISVHQVSASSMAIGIV